MSAIANITYIQITNDPPFDAKVFISLTQGGTPYPVGSVDAGKQPGPYDLTQVKGLKAGATFTGFVKTDAGGPGNDPTVFTFVPGKGTVLYSIGGSAANPNLTYQGLK